MGQIWRGLIENEREQYVNEKGEREKWELGSVKHAYKVFPSFFMASTAPYGAIVPLKEHSAAKAPPI